MKRKDQLIKIFEKCLLESLKYVDTKRAVEECYGDDISMFSTSKSNDDGIDMLESLVRDILEKINESFLQNELPQILSRESVEFRLGVLDCVIREYLDDQLQKEEQEKRDIQSARDAVANTQILPQGMNLSHILTHQSYQMKLKMKDELTGKVEELEGVKEKLLKEIEESQRDVKDVVTVIDKNIVDPLNKNADICSFNGIS